MKKLLALTVITSSLMAQGAFAVSSFTCEASMLASSSSRYAPKTAIAPAIVLYSKDSIAQSRYFDNKVEIVFDAETLKREEATVILDGRGKLVNMNVHLKLKATDKKVTVQLTDRLSGKSSLKTFSEVGASSEQVLGSSEANFNLNCTLH